MADKQKGKVTKKVSFLENSKSFEDSAQEDTALIDDDCEKDVDECCERIHQLLLRTKVQFSELHATDSESDEDDTDQDDNLKAEMKSKKELYSQGNCKDIYLKYCHDLNVIPASIFTRTCNTSIINLKHYGIGVKGARAVAKAMKYNQTVEELNLHDNGIGEEGMRAICNMMTANLWITRLDLSGNTVGKNGHEPLANMLKHAVRLKSLNLSRCTIHGGGAQVLISALSDNQRLERLDLSNNEIGDEGSVSFDEVFTKNCSLKSLDISFNCISFLSAEALCNGLSNNKSLIELSLAWNGLGDVGASHISTVLDLNPTLKVLDLVHNHISTTGIENIAESLQHNTSLEVLKIGRNPFLAHGARLILDSLQENPDTSLHELALEGIALDTSCETILSSLTTVKPTFVCKWDGSVRGGAVIEGEQALPTDLYLKAINSQGFRLLDFFRYLTKDSTSLTKEDFVIGSKKRNFPFSAKELAGLFDYLDTKHEGCISYEEFLFVKNDQRQTKLKQKRKSMSGYPESPIPQFQRLIRS